MKFLQTVLLAAALGFGACLGQRPLATGAPTTVYLVRHAEKAAGSAPGLTPAGAARADFYPRFFSAADLTAVYATPTRRTRATAAPLAAAKGLSVTAYDSDADVQAFAKTLLTEHAGQTIVVVGHSNTVPDIANALIGETRYAHIDHDDYTQVIQVVKRGDATGEGRVFLLEAWGEGR